jgi:hypothetical protein
MKDEQIAVLRQLAEGKRRPDGDERIVSRICGGLVNRKLAERCGSCRSRNDPTTLVAEYQITQPGLDYLEKLDAGLPTDLVPNAEGPAYIRVSIRRLADGTADANDAANVVRRAAELGLEVVRLTVARASEVRAGRGGTIKLLGRDGPRSSEDVKPERVDDAMWSAAWRTVDIKLWLRSPPARACAKPSQACAE